MEKEIIDGIKARIEEFADCRDEMDSQKVAVEIYEMVAQEILEKLAVPIYEMVIKEEERWY